MAINKYKDTIFDSSIEFDIPIKKSNSKDYFFKVPLKEIGYISLGNMILLIAFYIYLVIFWFLLYQYHFVAVTTLTIINIFFSVVVLLRDPLSGKNTLDMTKILYKYMRKKNIALPRARKKDLFSKNQL